MDCIFETTADAGVFVCRECRVPQKTRMTDPAKVHRRCIPNLLLESVRGLCAHRGDESRRQECSTCQGKVQLKVFTCALHGECTLEKPLAGVRTCKSCPDHRPHRPLRLLISTWHGLGDAVQMSVVLAHLRHYFPGVRVELAVPESQVAIFGGQADAVHANARAKDRRFAGGFDHHCDLAWFEARASYPDVPSTKAEKCLKEVFGLQPIDALCQKYRLDVSDAAREKARAWLATNLPSPLAGEGLGVRGFALLHYQGSSRKEQKDLREEDARWLCERLRDDFGLTPVVLDRDRTCPFVNPTNGIFRWDASNRDPELLAAVISEAKLFVGIDSGPLHVAAATTTTTIAIWREHHPLHYLCPASNVLNLVPPEHAEHVLGDRAAGLAYFQSRYRHRVYHALLTDTHDAIEDVLAKPTLATEDLFWAAMQGSLWPQEDPINYLPSLETYFRCLFRTVRELNPRSIVEIGVRAGYSAFTMLTACPAARYLGIDLDDGSEGGNVGASLYAAQLLAPFNAQVMLANSHHLSRLPDCDLAYIDGDHSEAGCRSDLEMAARSARRMLVDDYETIADVRRACDAFAADRAADWAGRKIENGIRSFFLLERR